MIFRFSVLVFLLVLLAGHAAPPELNPEKDLPRLPPVESKNAIKTFQIKKGFRVELAASEPNVVSPIALSFDENGRMFVVEMIDYSERRDEHLGRIRLLEDTDGDGRFDKTTVYAENLAWPTGVICYDGGIFVAATPDIIYFKDTNGDSRADVRKIIYTGFGTGKERLNVQALVNSFNWGMDNRIHGNTAPNGGIVTNVAVPSEAPLDLNNRNFSFDPRTLKMRPENGGGQYGMSFDSRGRKFVCSNSDHIMTFMYDGRYADRNLFYSMPRALVSIAVDGGAAEVYRISPEEPWRVIRTKWRVSGISPGIVEGGGRSAGYFTGATGITIYRGNAFPEEFCDNAFTGDAGGNLVHRKLVLPDGVGVKAQRPDDEQKVEFLASKDTWFRPVQFANAPDGTFYIIDMYRETIEHPWSLPEQIKKHLDLNSGNDRGRIYRIAPENFKQPKLPNLSKASTKELVATLEHPNGWHRDAAARLLFERQDKSAVSALKKLVRNSKSPLGRMHALHCLEGLSALGEDDVLIALNDSDATVREHAVKLSENFLHDSVPSKALFEKYEALTKDPSINVRYQLAFTLGEAKSPNKVSALRDIIQQDFENSWMQAAVLSSLAEGAGEMFGLIATAGQNKSSQEFLRQLVLIIAAKNNSREVAQVVDFLAKSNDRSLSFSLVRALGDGLERANSSLAKVGDMKKIFALATQVAADDKIEEPTRIQAIQLLALTSFSESSQSLLGLLNQNQSQAIQLASVAALANFTETEVGRELIKHWSSFTPRLRSETLSALLARPERVTALLGAIEQGTIRPADLSSPQIKFLKNHRDQNIRKQASKLFEMTTASQRQDVINAFQPALSLQGDTAHGKIIYMERCASCHRLDGEGFLLGPDLVTVQNSGKEKMLLNILDPNREVAPQFRAYEVETKDEESLIGLVANETATTVTLHQAFGKENVIQRAQIKKLQSQENSLMPEGLESGLKTQDIADLLEYISIAKGK
ncbi:MAG: PVC-type heme-binding CxxCH protein [Verrucomicrobiota bacterium]